MNKLEPGSVAKICTSGGGFKLRENIAAFRMILDNLERKQK